MADGPATVTVAVTDNLGDTEVAQLDHAGLVQEDVGGLYVTVDDADGVQRRERVRNRRANLDGVADGLSAAGANQV